MNTYAINYRENEHDTGVSIEIQASTDKKAIEAANAQVEQGFSDQAFASVDIQGGTYTCQNVNGKAVGETFNY